MEFWQIILLYLIQPVTWLGVILAGVLYYRRLKQERQLFRIAIDRDFYEGRHFLKTALFGLIVGGAVSLAAGLMLNNGAWLLLELAGVLGLLILPAADLSFILLWVAALVASCLNLTGNTLMTMNQHLITVAGSKLPANLLLMLVIFFLLRTFLLHYKKSTWFTPSVQNGKRGRRVAYYKWKEFSVIPLVVMIPADSWHSSVPYWPVFSFNGHSFGLLIFPLLVAASLKVFKKEPQEMLRYYRHQSLWLAGLCLLGAVGGWFEPLVAVGALLLVGILAGIFTFKRHRLDATGQRWYVETKEGVRVIAVMPDTPAAKMQIKKGDIILDCNNVAVHNEAELYAALQKNSAYCHLRVKTFTGDLKIAESAIYADSPHEIGLILFQ